MAPPQPGSTCNRRRTLAQPQPDRDAHNRPWAAWTGGSSGDAVNHAGPSRGRSPPAHPQPQGTSTAGRPSRYSWPWRVGGSCPATRKTGCPPKTPGVLNRRTERPRSTPSATVLGSRGVAGGRAASAPPLLKAAVGAFRGRGVTIRKTRARASSLGGLSLGSTAAATARTAAPPFWPRCRSAPLWGKGRGRRRCAAGLAHRRKRAKNWEWTKPLAARPPLPLTNSSKPPVTTRAAKACAGP